MPIIYDTENKSFHLSNTKISYVMQIVREGYLVHLYWGKKIRNYRGSNQILYYDRGFSPNPDPTDRKFSLDTIPQEYSAYGNGDFRMPAYQVEQENGSTVTDLLYDSHRIYEGKPKLEGLPSTYVETDNEAQTLEITLVDKLIGLKAILVYTIYEELNVITRSVRFENQGLKALKLLRALSMCVDFRDDEFEMITLYGAHTNEKNINRRPVTSGVQMIDSVRGASSPQQAPFVALVRKDTNEHSGEVFSFNFVYSGNFLAQVQVDPYYNTRVVMGINPFDFSWLLEQGEGFQTPEVVMTYSENGLGEMSKTYYDLYTKRLCRQFKDKPRPILINNWEATYFDFNDEKIIEIAKQGKELGMELFVLDDGWFGKRDNDLSSLGDWIVDRRKLPKGLEDVVKRVTDLGIQFGLWFEPEMVSEDSDLYRQHPDWCLHVPNRPRTVGRNQLILDLSRNDVCEYIIESLSTILNSADITYVKWDMNRHMTEIGSAQLPTKRQRETAHRYMLGLYYILETLTNLFPNVLFESCSSGGGRFDAGMLYYMPQTWTSDNTDAISRLKIQYGTSLVYHPITMGAHVSAVPNHQVGRITSLQTRGYVAMSGNLGYELDLTRLTEAEKNEVKTQVQFYKEIREIVQFGDFYRLISPFEGNDAAWNFVSDDQTECIAMYFKVLSEPGTKIKTFKLRGLDESVLYENVETKEVFGGDELMRVGITIPRVKQDFISYCYHFRKIN